MDIVERLSEFRNGAYADVEKQNAEIGMMRRVIAAQNASIAKLKKALERIADSSNWGDDGGWDADSYPNEIAEEALDEE